MGAWNRFWSGFKPNFEQAEKGIISSSSSSRSIIVSFVEGSVGCVSDVNDENCRKLVLVNSYVLDTTDRNGAIFKIVGMYIVGVVIVVFCVVTVDEGIVTNRLRFTQQNEFPVPTRLLIPKATSIRCFMSFDFFGGF